MTDEQRTELTDAVTRYSNAAIEFWTDKDPDADVAGAYLHIFTVVDKMLEQNEH
jgi:hypothetical protein